MKKEKIEVPEKIRYMSEWKGYSIFNFPHILNKQIPGCGFTEYCITNEEDVILCSPRKILLQNKYDQHKEDVYLVVNEYDSDPGTDKDLTKFSRNYANEVLKEEEPISEEDKNNFFNDLTFKISTYIKDCRLENKPVKILVTYDSFRIVKDILLHQGELWKYRVIIDEFQSIFTDSKFKSDTELQFVSTVQGIQRVCYVSATPMIDKYLDMLEEFKDLPYYELDWETLDPGRINKPKLTVNGLVSVYTEVGPIIKSYLEENFDHRFVQLENGEVKRVESKEAVFYVNSVNNITSIIKRAKLGPEQVNILVANTQDNAKKIKKRLGAKYKIGTVPLRNEPRKMFTFCTRTVYLGADFYSDNAKSYVVSDANIDTLAVDITLDLPQILGRQRLKENPWRNEATLFFKPIKFASSSDSFEKRLEGKIKKSENLLTVFDESRDVLRGDLSEKFQDSAKLLNYKKDFVAVNRAKIDGDTKLIPVFNNLVMVAEMRAYEIQQVDYANRFTVFNELGNISTVEDKDVLEKFFKEYEQVKGREKKLQFICDYYFAGNSIRNIVDLVTEKRFKEYLTILGPEKCKSVWYKTSELDKKLNIISFEGDKIFEGINKEFNVGESYTNTYIKAKLSEVYKRIGYKATAKANDLSNYYETKDCLLKENNKRVHGLKILSKKER
jgi:hypothetical protein